LKYLPQGCHWIGVEPNPYMHDALKRRAAGQRIEAEFRLATAEAIAADDSSVDVVLSTLVLCSVGDITRVLREIHRVLRPGGRFCFIEHVAAPHQTWLRRCQRAMRPVWMWLGDGCQPDRDTAAAIQQVGFADVATEAFTVPTGILPRLVSPQISGVATKAS